MLFETGEIIQIIFSVKLAPSMLKNYAYGKINVIIWKSNMFYPSKSNFTESREFYNVSELKNQSSMSYRKATHFEKIYKLQ